MHSIGTGVQLFARSTQLSPKSPQVPKSSPKSSLPGVAACVPATVGGWLAAGQALRLRQSSMVCCWEKERGFHHVKNWDLDEDGSHRFNLLLWIYYMYHRCIYIYIHTHFGQYMNLETQDSTVSIAFKQPSSKDTVFLWERLFVCFTIHPQQGFHLFMCPYSTVRKVCTVVCFTCSMNIMLSGFGTRRFDRTWSFIYSIIFEYYQWIGLRENLQETIDFPSKYGVFL